LAAEAEAYRVLKRAEAEQQSIEMIATALSKEGGAEVVQMRLSEEYFKAFSNIAKEGNTVVIPSNLGDVTSMIAAGSAAFKTVNK